MSYDLLQSVEASVKVNSNVPELLSGDTVRVFFKIIEGGKERIQRFDGVVMRLRGGDGVNASFTVRRIGADGVGVERTFPFRSPRIDRVEVVRHAHVRRKNLYFLRERRGKAARLRDRRKALPGANKRAAEALAAKQVQPQFAPPQPPVVPVVPAEPTTDTQE